MPRARMVAVDVVGVAAVDEQRVRLPAQTADLATNPRSRVEQRQELRSLALSPRTSDPSWPALYCGLRRGRRTASLRPTERLRGAGGDPEQAAVNGSQPYVVRLSAQAVRPQVRAHRCPELRQHRTKLTFASICLQK